MTMVSRIQELLGGEPITGPLHSERDIVRLVRRGVPPQAVDHFLKVARLSFWYDRDERTESADLQAPAGQFATT